MIVDLHTAAALDLPRDAVLVVGAGAAGLAIALRLGDAGTDVVLVESGGDVGDSQAQTEADALNVGEVQGQSLDLAGGRSRVLGGTTLLWHGQCMRLHPIDVEPRPWVARSGWPIGLGELQGPYAQAEEWMGASGRGYDEERWSELGNAPVPWDPSRLRHDFTEYLRRPFLGRTHRDRLETHPRVHALIRATVASVLVEDGRAVGVEVRSLGGRTERVRAAQVVLAAGAFENARVLQLSDPDGVGLGDGREHTGRYLQEHPIIRTARVRSHDHRVLQSRFVVQRTGNGRRLFPKVRLDEQAQREHGLLDATAVFVHDAPAPVESVHRLLVAARRRERPQTPAQDVRAALLGAPTVARAVLERAVSRRVVGVPAAAVWLQVWVEQAPDPDRRVELADTRDELGLRRARVHWGVDDEELRTSRTLTRWIGQDLVRLGIGHLEELPAMTDDGAWRAAVTDAAHPAGTTRMSLSPADGVVDTDLRVHGIEDLYVVGGSVLPTSGYANPTLTIVALAVRLADHLRSRRGPQRARGVAATSSSRATATPVGTGSAAEA